MAHARALLLAGGRAVRFGAPKLLAHFRGRPLVAHAVASLREAGLHPLAVVRLGDAELAEVLRKLDCEVIETDRAERGMGASLAAGVEATADAPGWLVALGDMPLVRAETVRAVNAALGTSSIAIPVLPDGRRGHPVGFASALREELLALDGDVGARSIVQRHAAQVATITVDDPGIVADVDMPGDIEALDPRLRGDDF